MSVQQNQQGNDNGDFDLTKWCLSVERRIARLEADAKWCKRLSIATLTAIIALLFTLLATVLR